MVETGIPVVGIPSIGVAEGGRRLLPCPQRGGNPFPVTEERQRVV